MRVLKFGGSSLSSIGKIKKVANFIKQSCAEPCVIVVSAMKGFTDAHLKLAGKISKNYTGEVDALLATGEMISASLLSLALNDIGVPTVSMNCLQLNLKASGNFGEANPVSINKTKLEKLLKKQFIVVCGFQGVKDGQIVTLGRNGSDLTAVFIASQLNCDCEIYTDVDGIFAIDPKICKNSIKYKKIDYNLLIQCQTLKVMEKRSLILAKEKNISVYVGKSLKNISQTGTLISTEKSNAMIVCTDQNFSQIYLNSHNISKIHKKIEKIFKKNKIYHKLLELKQDCAKYQIQNISDCINVLKRNGYV